MIDRIGQVIRGSALSLTGVFLLVIALTIQQLWTPDTWWQLRTGQWIVEHGAIPKLDQFSYTVRHHEWIELRWLFCVLEYLAWRAGGPGALVLGQFIVVGAAFVLVCSAAHRSLSTVAGIAALAFGIAAGASRYTMRPELVSFVMMAAFLLVLHRASRGRGVLVPYILPVLQIVWVNSHTLFVFGPILAWCFALGDTVERIIRRWLKWKNPTQANDGRIFNSTLWIVAPLVTAACWVNPYGHRGAMFPFLLFSEIQADSVLGGVIEEFGSPLAATVWAWDFYAAALLALICIIFFVVHWQRLNLIAVGLFAAHLYLWLIASRNVGLFAIVGTWTALTTIDAARVPAGDQALRGFRRSLVPLAHLLMTAALAAASWYVITDRFALRMGSQHAFGLGVAPWSVPRDATEFLLAQSPEPNLFHSMADGAYLAWRAHEKYRVHIDGRLEVYGEPFIAEYAAIDPANWHAYAQKHGINTVVVQIEKAPWLASALQASSQWQLVHITPRSVVFVKNSPEHAALIETRRIDPRRPHEIGPAEEDYFPGRLRAMIGAKGRPWHSLGMAKAFIVLGGINNAIAFLERGLRQFADHDELRLTLAMCYRAQDRQTDANRLLANMRIGNDDTAWSQELLANMHKMNGRLADAAAALERAAQAAPEDEMLLRDLAHTSELAGEFGGVARAYRRLAMLHPNTADPWIRAGIAHERMGELQLAAECYENALRLSPNLATLHNQYGIVMARLGRIHESRQAFEQAIRIDPNYQQARQNLEQLSSP